MSEQTQNQSLVTLTTGRDVVKKATLTDSFLIFAQAKQEGRHKSTLKELADHVLAHLSPLIPTNRTEDARALLESFVLGDPSFFQAPLNQVKGSIDAWFTRPDGLPSLIADLVAFLNEKE
jgi:hypothetical protein